jgi:antitoxin (DNA-binding transcriptional repressor) of toxin-antitoxin stability system
MSNDLVITNGVVVDGSGLPGYRADVAVRHGLRTYVMGASGTLAPWSAREDRVRGLRLADGRPAERVAIAKDRVRLIFHVDVPRQFREVEIGEEDAPVATLVPLAGQHVHVDRAFSPDPDLADTEPPVDLELVDPAAGPDDLDNTTEHERT